MTLDRRGFVRVALAAGPPEPPRFSLGDVAGLPDEVALALCPQLAVGVRCTTGHGWVRLELGGARPETWTARSGSAEAALCLAFDGRRTLGEIAASTDEAEAAPRGPGTWALSVFRDLVSRGLCVPANPPPGGPSAGR